MGYELEMHVHREGEFCTPDETGTVHGVEIATLELSKVDNFFHAILDTANKTNIFGAFYASDGDTLIKRDCYAAPLARVKAKEILAALQTQIKATPHDCKPYRRYVIAAALLSSILETFEPDEIYCYFYGH
jgi:hypothetical protein